MITLPLFRKWLACAGAMVVATAGCGVRDGNLPKESAPKVEAGSTGYTFPTIGKRRPAPGGGTDIDSIESAASRAPDNPEAQRKLGLAYYANGGYRAAVNVLETAVRLNDNDGVAWLYLGYAQMGAGQVEAALESLAKASRAQLPPKQRAAALAESGTIRYQALRDDKRAMEDFRAALELDPGEGTAALALGTDAAERQRAGDARKYFELAAKSLKPGPERAAVYACLGRLAEEAKNQSAAKDWYRKALVDDKDNPWAKSRLTETKP